MQPIIAKRKENLFQVACLRLFEATHKGCVTENVGNHPNGYFNSSIAYNKEVEKHNKNKGPSVATSGTTSQVNSKDEEKEIVNQDNIEMEDAEMK